MNTTDTTIVEAVRSMTNKDMTIAIIELQAQVKALQDALAAASKPANQSKREMTADDARRILTGDHKASKHQVAADALGLSYGQVYSCRLEHTFKAVHKEMKDAGVKNEWIKA